MIFKGLMILKRSILIVDIDNGYRKENIVPVRKNPTFNTESWERSKERNNT